MSKRIGSILLARAIGTSVKTLLKEASSPKKALSEYMSEESSHTTVSFGKIFVTEISEGPSPLATMSGKMSASFLSSKESWVLPSKTDIFTTSFPKKLILKGLLSEYEKISIREPLMANCPGAETKSTLSKPCAPIISTIFSWLISSPTFILSRYQLILEVSGISSSRASG